MKITNEINAVLGAYFSKYVLTYGFEYFGIKDSEYKAVYTAHDVSIIINKNLFVNVHFLV